MARRMCLVFAGLSQLLEKVGIDAKGECAELLTMHRQWDSRWLANPVQL